MWAQDRTRVFVTVKLQDIQNEEITFAEERFVFKGHTLDSKVYGTDLELFGEILPDDPETKYVKYGRYLQLNLRKKDSTKWWPRLAKTDKKLHNVKIDWEKWVDDQDDDLVGGGDDGFEIPNAADSQMTSSSDSSSSSSSDSDDGNVVEDEAIHVPT